MMYHGMVQHTLSPAHSFWTGQVPAELRLDQTEFEELWRLHPGQYHEIMMHGRMVPTPRWQQAYGKDYAYAGQVNQAQPLEALTVRVPKIGLLLAWCQQMIEPCLNGLLLNWYDGSLGHYIGKHRDSTRNIVDDTPIVTISCGDTRIFRLRPWQGQGCRDFLAADGDIFVMPFATNLAWTHEVPKTRSARGRRISLTIRSFE